MISRGSRIWVAIGCAAACSSTAPRRVDHTSAATAVAAPDASVAGSETAPTPVANPPPVAARRSHPVVSPNGTRDDPYYWLRDDSRSDRDVLGYLEAENRYAAAALAPAQKIEDALVRETRARIPDTDTSAAILEDGYWYYTRLVAGAERKVYARRKGTMSAPEEIVLDANALANGHAFYKIGDYAVSRDGTLVAWTDDSVGRLQFTLHVRRLATGEQLPDTITNISPTVLWANDNKTMFVVGKDDKTLREDRVMRVALGAKPEVAFREADEAYYVDVAPTKSHRFIEITLDATETTETRLIDADKPATAPRVFVPRATKQRYSVDHLGGKFVMRTNVGAETFRVVEVPAAHPERRTSWKELVPGRSDAVIDEIALYDTFMAADVRVGGLSRVQVFPKKGTPYFVEASEPTFDMSVVDTPDATSTRVRFTYDSLVSPTATYEQDVATKTRTLLHRDPAPTYDAGAYATEYLHAAAPDGTQIPISLVYRKGTPRDGTAPLLLAGYGAYGEPRDPEFEETRVSLLDRGFVYAIAHVRGGGEFGQPWYDAGRLLHKQNTFNDFIAATEYLISERYAARDKVFAEAASAGGLLIGVLANKRPDLYRGLIAWVPFVDAVTTMLDDTIPLTTNEYDEWGDPHDKAAYDNILSYSPYDNVHAQSYPAMYVRTGLWDSQVQYYEPAKWVAKLRATKTDAHLLALETDMSAGHAGKSGRYEAVTEQARAYAFILYVLGGAGATK